MIGVERCARELIIAHLGHMMRIQPLKKSRRFRQIEFFVAGFDAQEEAVGGGVLRKTLDIEQRVMTAAAARSRRACRKPRKARRPAPSAQT